MSAPTILRRSRARRRGGDVPMMREGTGRFVLAPLPSLTSSVSSVSSVVDLPGARAHGTARTRRHPSVRPPPAHRTRHRDPRTDPSSQNVSSGEPIRRFAPSHRRMLPTCRLTLAESAAVALAPADSPNVGRRWHSEDAAKADLCGGTVRADTWIAPKARRQLPGARPERPLRGDPAGPAPRGRVREVLRARGGPSVSERGRERRRRLRGDAGPPRSSKCRALLRRGRVPSPAR